MGQCKIFISHASSDCEIIKHLVDFLSGLYVISRNEITFTSLPESGIENFSNFNDELRKDIQECKLAIVYLTQNYLKSNYCLFELGAIWSQNKNCFLINRDNITKDKIPDILLAHTYDKLDNRGLDKLCDTLEKLPIETKYNGHTEYNSYKQRVLEQISLAEQKRLSEKQPKSVPVKIAECSWEKVQGNTEAIEKSAGYTKIGDIYRTTGSYPKHYIMRTSARVFNWEGENHFDKTAKPHYCLLVQREKDEICQKIILIDETQEGQEDLSSLYNMAQVSSEQRLKLSDLLMHPVGIDHETMINLLKEKGYKVTKPSEPLERSKYVEDFLS